MRLSRRIAAVAFAILGLAAAPLPAAGQSAGVVIFAAASLKSALDEINAQWQHESGRKAVISYAASPALARQIEQGAPADIFISADLDWMDYVQQRNLIRTDTRSNLLGNRLVLIAPRESRVSLTIGPGIDLARLLGNGRLAMADTSSVPAGRYGKAALERLGVWPSLQQRTAQSENVRAALLLVSRGEAPLGIVYRTDAAADPGVRIVDTFPEAAHPAIVYPLALTAVSRHADAAAVLAYLGSAKARPLWEKQGFIVIGAGRPGSS